MIRFDDRLIVWAVFFLTLGLVPLAVRSGLVATDVRWWELWPLLLIGWGLSLLLRATPGRILGGLLVAGTLGAMLGGALTAGLDIGRIGLACGRSDGSAFAGQNGAFPGPRAAVDLELSCGELTVVARPGSGWSVSGTAPGGQSPIIEGDADRLTVRSMSERRGFFWLFDASEAWRVELPTEVVLDLSVTLNAGEAAIDPGPARLDRASITLNAGSATLDLDTASLDALSATVNAGFLVVRLPAADLFGSLTVNAGSIAICAPPGVGLRLTTNEDRLGAFDYPGLTRTGNTWTNTEYATAAVRIDLSTTANAGAISLDTDEACR
ncbi:MAG: hypothetical protein KatS3mg065_0710 [Chloroflexota bacterium]|nr:MAG: hypothetical protein KatS3mg065_0710 [Chloroflexota bacterium]